MKVAIVGGGHIASIHAPLIQAQPGNQLVAIVDKDLSHAKALAAQFNVNNVYQDVKVMLEEQKPEVVHVLTPPQYHADIAITVMDNGCHVYVEKPLALNVPQAKKMIEAAERNNVRLCAGHNMIFEGTVQRALKCASDGSVGEIVSVEVDLVFDPRRAPAFIEEGTHYFHWLYGLNGGPLQDLIPHPISMVMEFLGEIDEIKCCSNNRGVLPAGWPDEIRVSLKSGRTMGYIRVSLSEKPDTIVLTIKGTKGRASADLFTGIMTLQKKSLLPRAAVRGLSGFFLANQYFKGGFANIFKFLTGKIDKSNGIGPLVARFYESLRNGTEQPVSLEKGLAVVDVMDRIWPEPVVKSGEKEESAPLPDSALPLVLVTGASGFIGSHVVKKLLSMNAHVRALVRPNSLHAGRLKKLPVEVVYGSLDDPESVEKAVAGVETIYHLGAAMTNGMEEQRRVTIGGTENIINAALKHNVKRVLHVSTLAVYELLEFPVNTLITEESPYLRRPEKMGAYSYAKIEAEKLILDAVRNKGLQAAIVRLGMVVGPYGPMLYPHLGFKYQDVLFMPIGKGDTVLPFTYIENTVDGIIKTAQSEKAVGEIYNLVDDGEVTVRQYLEKLIKVANVPARILPLPYFIPWCAMLAYEIAAAMGLLKKGVTSRTQLKWKQARMRYDTSKAKDDLGWEMTVPLEEGMERTFKWFAEKYGYKRQAQ